MQVARGANLQALIDANPPSTTFCFAPGVYQLPGMIWTDDKFPRFDLRAGAVLDGQNGTLKRNAVVDGTEFRENFNAGLVIFSDNARVTNAYVHHNGKYGIAATIIHFVALTQISRSPEGRA